MSREYDKNDRPSARYVNAGGRDSDIHKEADGDLDQLHEFSIKLLNAASLQDAIDLAGSQIIDITQAQSVSIFLLDLDGSCILRSHKVSSGVPTLHDLLPVPESLTWTIQRTGQTLFISGLEGDEEEVPPELYNCGIRAIIGLPLQVGSGIPLGVLHLAYTSPHSYCDQEINKLKCYSLQISLGIEYLNLVEENRRKEMDLNLIIDTSHLVISTLDLEELIQQVAVRMVWVLGMNSCAVSTFHRDPDRLRLLAEYSVLGDRLDKSLYRERTLANYPLLSEALRNNEPKISRLNDPEAKKEEVELLKERGGSLLLMLPLKAGGEPVGLLELYSQREDFQISTSGLKRMRALSEQVALAVVNSRHYQEEQRARSMAETLRSATSALTSTLEVSQVLNLILENIQKVVHYDSGSLMLLEKNVFSVAAVRGHPSPQEALNIRLDLEKDELSSLVYSSKGSIIIPDAQKDPRFHSLGKSDHVRGWMCIPMISRGEVIGLLTLDSRKEDAYSDMDAKMALTFAGHAALAVSNARLYQQEQDHRALAEVLREISLVLLSRSLDPEAVLQILLEQIEQVIPFDTGAVLIVEDEIARVACHRGFDKHGEHRLKELFIPVEQTPNLKVIAETRRSHSIPNVNTYPGWVHWSPSESIVSWVGAPLIGRERVLGFLSLGKTEPHYYTEKHIATMEMLASHASLALLNAYAYHEAEQASITDFITNTYNHRFFQQQLRQALKHSNLRSQSLGLLMIDLDHFKIVNDNYGHQCGDMILKIIASRLKEQLRTGDILARYGGEEFAVILPGSSEEACLAAAERLRKATAQNIIFGDNEISITVSIGVTMYPKHALNAQKLISAADHALYLAKESGRNKVCIFQPDS
jgi:diguanylate cyclase (GGDEF)-like protein